MWHQLHSLNQLSYRLLLSRLPNSWALPKRRNLRISTCCIYVVPWTTTSIALLVILYLYSILFFNCFEPRWLYSRYCDNDKLEQVAGEPTAWHTAKSETLVKYSNIHKKPHNRKSSNKGRVCAKPLSQPCTINWTCFMSFVILQ